MADRRTFDPQSMNPKLKMLQGVFSVSGTANPAPAAGYTRGVTVTRSSAGKYKVTWADTYKRLVSFTCSMNHDSSTTAQTKKDVRGGKVATASNYVEILLRSAGAVLTNPSTNTTINWSLAFEDGDT